MEPSRIQYATTADGVNIAYAVAGEGMPVISVPPVPWSDLQAEWADPGHRAFYTAVARGMRWIRYDSRGSGSSDRDIPELTADNFIDSLCLDIEAVVDKLGLDSFALAGIAIGGPMAIRFAARHPDRVTKLILWCSSSRLEDVATPQGQAMQVLRETDFDLFTETAAHAMIAGWGSGDEARSFAAFMRKSTTPGSPPAVVALESDFDTTADLEAIKCPTLVLHRKEANFPGIQAARYIAARVPDSHLVVLDGGALLPWVGDLDAVVREMDDFLGVESVPPASEPEAQAVASTGMVTILFTDIEGSTTLTQRLGDERAQQIVRAHNTIVRDALKNAGGTEIKHTGDGIMASFPLTSHAVEASVAIQRAAAAHSEANPDDAFRVRAGLNAGEPVAEKSPDGHGDLFGSAVQLARRVCDAAPAGSIYVTDVVRQLVAGKGLAFADQGAHDLRGFEDPVTVYEVSWRE